MFACFSSPIGLWGCIWPLLSPQMSSVTQVAPLLAHGLLFARPSKTFAALGLHFWRPRGTYLLVFEVSFTSLSFFHAPHSNKKPTGFQSGNNKSFASPIRSVSQTCCKKCTASSQLMPREARHLRLVYIYIYSFLFQYFSAHEKNA